MKDYRVVLLIAFAAIIGTVCVAQAEVDRRRAALGR